MFNAPCGVRSPVSERKRLLCLGLCYVLKIVSDDLAWVVKKIIKIFSDSSMETYPNMRHCCWPLPQQLSVCLCALWRGDDAQGQNATTGISNSELSRTWGENTDRPLNVHCGYRLPFHTSGFFFLSHSNFDNSFPSWRTVTHCRKKASRCILIRQERGLQLIDITVILWSTFFFLFLLRCTVECVCIGGLWLSYFTEEKKDTGGTFSEVEIKQSIHRTGIDCFDFFYIYPFELAEQFLPW